jgi:hypothetical protein
MDEGFQRLFARVVDEQVRLRREGSRMVACPPELAFGRIEPCREEACPFYRVPGVPRDCAVRHWCPEASRSGELAKWVLERRRDFELARRGGE